MSNCFVAAIVKGLLEYGDDRRYFGSFGALNHYRRQTVKLGLVRETTGMLTKKGRDYYVEKNLRALPYMRAYFWPEQDWSPTNTKP